VCRSHARHERSIEVPAPRPRCSRICMRVSLHGPLHHPSLPRPLTRLLLGSAGRPSIQLCTLCPSKSPFLLIDAVPMELIMHLLNRPFPSSITFSIIVEQYSSTSTLHGSQSPFAHILVAAAAEKQLSGRSFGKTGAQKRARIELDRRCCW
jgi:hypothetical protein